MTECDQVSFDGSGGRRLSGVLDRPPKTPEGYGLMAHCFTGGKDHHATRRISRALTDRGLAMLRFDFAGLGDSGGEFGTFSSDVDDIAHAARYLTEHHGPPSLIIGHSLGGAAVLAAAADINSIDAVVTIGAPSDPAHVTHLFADAMADIDAHGSGTVMLGGQQFTISSEYLEDLQDQQQRERIAALGRPLLILHAPGDEVVGVDHARMIYEAARHPKSFVSLDGADHLLTQPRHAKRVAQLVAAWADPYLPEEFTPEID